MFLTACDVELTGLLVQRKEMEAHRAGDQQGHADAEDDLWDDGSDEDDVEDSM